MSGLHMYVIYKNPSDFPNKYVVRRWTFLYAGKPVADAEPFVVSDTLEGAREPMVELDRYNMGRLPGDDPAILEVWF